MSIEHIVQAVAHLREPIVSLDQMNPGQETAGKDVVKTAPHGKRWVFSYIFCCLILIELHISEFFLAFLKGDYL